MLALLGNFISGGFLGLLTSLLPAILNYFTTKQNNTHELAMRELDIKASEAQSEQTLRQIDTSGQWAEVKALVEAQSRPSGVKWIDGLSSFIRPFLTLYWCVGVFTAVKVIQLYLMSSVTGGVSMLNFLTVFFGDFEQQIIAAIFMYWFGQRSFYKNKVGKA